LVNARQNMVLKHIDEKLAFNKSKSYDH
jgi:hypothetical protein